MFKYLINLSPVDQFLIFPIFRTQPVFFDLIVLQTNISLSVVMFFIIFVFFTGFIVANTKNIHTAVHPNRVDLNLVPHPYQVFFELIFLALINLINDNIRSEMKQKFLPIITFLFFFVLFINLFGLIPYSYTLTSQLCVTFALSLILFIGINIICFKIHKFHIFGLFLPNGTSFVLSFLLVPIEFISYIFRPISLSIRLFANMMAGHTLLKVIAGFAWTLISLSGLIFVVLHFIPFIILIPLFFLETAVAIIQAFVFTVLICIYINDAINLH
jgi:ATP synthase subunit 6